MAAELIYSSQDVSDARESFHAHMRDLCEKKASFGRSDSLSHEEDMMQAPRPFPNFFAWDGKKKADDVLVPKEKVLKKVPSASKIPKPPTSQDKAHAIFPLPVVEKAAPPLPAAVEKTTTPVSGPEELKPEKEQEVLEKKVAVQQDHVKPVVKRDEVSVVESPTVVQGTEVEKQKDLPAKKEALVPVRTTPPPSGITKQSKIPKPQVTPRYLLPKKSVVPISIEKPSTTSTGGGGGRASVVMDQLAVLCKQHQLQYRKCKQDSGSSHINDDGDALSAGVANPFEATPPTFFAWTASDFPSVPPTLPPAYMVNTDVTSAGRKTKWEEAAPSNYAWTLEELQKQSRDNLKILAKEIKEPSTEPSKVEAASNNILSFVKSDDEDKSEIADLVTKKLEATSPVAKVAIVSPKAEVAIISPKKVHFDEKEPQQIISESPVTTVKEDDTVTEAREELKRQRAVGKKHRRFLAEIESKHVPRTEYMATFRWPAQDLVSGHVGCVSAFASRLLLPEAETAPAAGAPARYHPHVVNTGASALSVACETTKEFLKKKLNVPGSIEAMEQAAVAEGSKSSKTAAKKVEEAPETPLANALKEKEVEATTLIVAGSTRPGKKSDRGKKLKKSKGKKINPNNFAWVPKKKSKSRPRMIKRWKAPRVYRLGNPITEFKRYPVPITFHPATEYQKSYNRVASSVLKKAREDARVQSTRRPIVC